MILSMDLGSTSFKAAVFDAEGNETGRGAVALSYRYGVAGEVEIPVGVAIDAFRDAAAAALAAAKTSPDSLRALGLTSQAQTFTVLDPHGRPLLPFRSWQDVRAEETIRALQEDAGLANFGEHAGFGRILSALLVAQLHHLRHATPGRLEADAQVCPLPAFFVQQCAGKAVLDDNSAAMTGLYSLETNGWWPPALRAAGVAPEQLPYLVSIGLEAARTDAGAEAYGLPADLPIVLAGNDQTAGAYGAGVHEAEGTVLITLGTAQVAYRLEENLPPPAANLFRGPYPGGRYYRLAADACGGNLVNWAETVLAGCGRDADFFEAAAAADDPGALTFEADLAGGAGAWRNLALRHGPGHLARAVLAALCRRMRTMVSDDLGVDPARARFVAAGGGTTHSLWVEMLEKELGARITVTPAGPLRGAARIAAAALAS